MGYQVLARKWRPRFFDEMVGQEHVLRALINALNNQQLHHAYLFTGTRGVGKTTIARILAKCLNCEQGISARPCGTCSACTEIAEGRFVDLIEVDAASRTKVEDTRELLDNVQYAPTRGRYKIYLIDEVHMLSNHSFNALLKTLEEPPAHVKFLLATTDPQKLPITVLSRCLQFNLKNMPAEQIVKHLQHVLSEEKLRFEEPALWQLGRAAHGSMRDALSLTDQAIAYGEGMVSEEHVHAMLGTMDRGRLFKLAELMAKADAAELMNEIALMAEHAPDYDEVMQGLLSIWHKVALAQVLPSAIDNIEGEQAAIMALAQAMQPEDVQLYYQIGVSGRTDLALAPDPRQGFEMLVLRMLAFCPVANAPAELDLVGALQKKKPVTADSEVSTPIENSAPATSPAVAPIIATEPEPEPEPEVIVETVIETELPVVETIVEERITSSEAAIEPPGSNEEPVRELLSEEVREDFEVQEAATTAELPELAPHTWWQYFERLSIGALIKVTASHMALTSVQGHHYEFDLDPSQSFLFNDSHQEKIQQALREYIADATIEIRLQLPSGETPAQREQRLQIQNQAAAEQVLAEDEVLQSILSTFNAEIIEGSIRPLTSIKEES